MNKQKNNKYQLLQKLSFSDIEKVFHQYKEEELPDAETSFHYEAEIWSGFKMFLSWLDVKQKSNN